MGMAGPKINRAVEVYVKKRGGVNKRIFAECLRKASPLGNVLHVGAHIAEEIPLYVALLHQGVTWIEASDTAFRKVQQILKSQKRRRMRVIKACAWSVSGKTLTLSHSQKEGQGYDGRSTVYELRQSRTAKLQEPCANEEVQTVALDDILQPEFQTVIVDVQGAELEALKGMPRIIKAAQAVIVEACWIPIMGGPSTMQGVINYLWEFGFFMTYYCGYNETQSFGDALFWRGELPEGYQIGASPPLSAFTGPSGIE